jgi:hypothetical protein
MQRSLSTKDSEKRNTYLNSNGGVSVSKIEALVGPLPLNSVAAHLEELVGVARGARTDLEEEEEVIFLGWPLKWKKLTWSFTPFVFSPFGTSRHLLS